jgi:hypothetical protein
MNLVDSPPRLMGMATGRPAGLYGPCIGWGIVVGDVPKAAGRGPASLRSEAGQFENYRRR